MLTGPTFIYLKLFNAYLFNSNSFSHFKRIMKGEKMLYLLAVGFLLCILMYYTMLCCIFWKVLDKVYIGMWSFLTIS
jgi:hypothetical protein